MYSRDSVFHNDRNVVFARYIALSVSCTHCNRSLTAQDEVGPATIQLPVLESPLVADFVQAGT
jgi:hypothetical protein